MNQAEHEILLMVLSEVKDIRRMQEHQGQVMKAGFAQMERRMNQMEKRLDEVYELSLDNYGAIREHETRFRLLEEKMG